MAERNSGTAEKTITGTAAETDTAEEKVPVKEVALVKAEFTADYRGSFGAFNAGDTCEIEQAAFSALSKSGVCRAVKETD